MTSVVYYAMLTAEPTRYGCAKSVVSNFWSPAEQQCTGNGLKLSQLPLPVGFDFNIFCRYKQI